ncbi:MAG TPA: hypothetical protein PKA98_23960, partial [Acidimicrobiales bacterium]|nr:hypothetical protein [Acidimicrobiales bacterium]
MDEGRLAAGVLVLVGGDDDLAPATRLQQHSAGFRAVGEVDDVGAHPAIEHVLAFDAEQPVGAGAAGQHIVAGTTVELVKALAAEQQIGPVAAVHALIADGADQNLGVAVADER